MIEADKLYLSPPTVDLWRDFRAACLEFRRERVEDFAYPRVDTLRQFKRFARQRADWAAGINLPENCVPQSTFWLTDGERYIGGGDLRHFLNDDLRRFGGHMGYSVRPSRWGLGLGTQLLSLLLDEARKLDISIARVTCFDENAASARIIEKNGGFLVDTVENVILGKPRLTRVYDILL